MLDGKINMANARQRIDKFLQTKQTDEEQGQNNVAIWNLLTGSRAPVLIEEAKEISDSMDERVQQAERGGEERQAVAGEVQQDQAAQRAHAAGDGDQRVVAQVKVGEERQVLQG